MASKKNTVDLISQMQRAYRRRLESVDEQAKAIAAQAEADGTPMSDTAIRDMKHQLALKGMFDVAQTEDEAADVVLPSTTVDMPQMRGLTAQEAYDADTTDWATRLADFGPNLRAGAREGLAALLEAPVAAYNAAERIPTGAIGIASRLGILPERATNPQFITEEAQRLRQQARDIRILETSEGARAAADVLEEAEGFGGTLATLARNPSLVSDQLGQQVGQMLPTVAGGGPEGMLALSALQAGSQAATDTRQRAKQKGMSDADADRAADMAFAVSAGVNAIIPKVTPGGMSLERLATGKLIDEGLDTATKVAMKPLIGEAVTETFTESVEQIGQNLAVGDSWDDQLGKSAALGFAIGASMGAAPAAARVHSNRRGWQQLEDDARTNARIATEEAQAANRQRTNAIPIPTAEEAFAIREKQLEAEKAAQEEELFSQIDESNAESVRGMELRDMARANPESPLAQQLAEVGTAVTPRSVKQAEPETQTVPQLSAEQLAALEEAKKLTESDTKAIQKKATDDLKLVKKQHADARKTELARLAEATRNITDVNERTATVAEGIINWDKANPVPTTVPEGWTPPKAKKATVPKRVPNEVSVPKVQQKAPVAEETVEKIPRKITGPLDQRVSDLTTKLGLEMQEAETKAGRKPNVTKFKNDANNIITELVSKGDKDAADTLTLISQGKLVLTPTPESVGLTASENGKAQFVPEDGKMYIFTDRIKKGDAAGNIIRAIHEATHAGQFNDRQGRSSVMQQIMGRDKSKSAENLVRKAASNGNVLAKRAVAAAKKAAPEGTEVNSLEVLPYLVGEIARNRNTSLGQLGSIGRDILAGARNMLRGAGLNLDVSYNDIYSAVKDVQSEIAQTKLTPKDFNGGLEMIYPSTATGFKKAVEDGRVYVNKTGKELFVLTDAGAKVKDSAVDLLNDTDPDKGEVYLLRDLMDHPVLYEQMPKAKNIQVGIMREQDGSNNWGQYYSGQNFIEVSDQVVNGKADVSLREILLHEIQHWVQDASGRSSEFKEASKASKYTPEELKDIDRYNKVSTEVDKAARKLLDKSAIVGRALPSPEEKRSFMRAMTNKDNPSFYRAEAMIQIANTLTNVSENFKPLADEFTSIMDEWREAAKAYNAAVTARRKRYIGSAIEEEAFFTQAYSNAPQEGIPINPEKSTGYGSEKLAKGDLVRQASERSGLQMEEDDNSEAPKERKVPAWITGMFRADKGLSSAHNEILEYAITSPAGKRMEAEAALGRYEQALRELAAERGQTVKELNKEIEDALAGMEDTEGWDANLAQFDKAVEKFGEAGAALRELRDIADDLSLLMLEQRAEDPKPLTAEERKIYSKISSNLGRYTHRMYASQSGELGKMYSNALWKDYTKFKEAEGEVTDPVVENNYNTVNNAINTIVNDSLLIPSDKKLARASVDRINSLYSVWGSSGRTEGMTVDAKRDELAQIRDKVNGDTDALTREAENIVRELLNLEKADGPITSYYRGGKQNTGILQKRENIPASIRKVMGEITDPGMKFVATVAKQSQFLAANKMFLELSNNLGDDILAPGSSRPKGWTTLSGEGYGPLEGYIVSPNMLAAVGDVKQQFATFEQLVGMMNRDPKGFWRTALGHGVDAWGTLASTSKMAQIVFNPANMIYNFAGGGATMLMNGNVNPKYFAKAVRDAKDIVMYSINPTKATEAANELVKYDIVDSAFVGEIKNEQYRALRTLVRGMVGRERSDTMQGLANGLHTLKAGWKETYAMMDVTFKIANFHKEVDFLKDFYEKSGIERTDEQIKREAADITKRTNFTFRRVAPILKAMEAGGVTAFGPYMHEVFRTQISNVLQGFSEIKRARTASTPEAAAAMRARGVSRLAGQSAMWAMTAAASLALAKATFGDDAEEEKNLRALLGDMYGDQDFIQVGTDKNGYPVLMAWSRIDPYGPITDFMRAAMNEQADVGDLIEKLGETYIAPRLIGQVYKAWETFKDDKKVSRKPLVQTASTALADKIGVDLYSEMMDIGEMVGLDRRETKAITNIFENLYGPGIMTSWRETNARPVETDPQGAAVRAASYAGFTFQSLDPSKPLAFAGMDYSNMLKNNRSKLKEFFDDNVDRSENEIIRRLTQLRRTEKEEFKDAREVYLGALAAGMSPRQAAAALKAARVSNEAISAIASGKFDSGLISKKSIDASMKQELDAAPRSEHNEIKRKWKNIWQLLSGAARNVTEEE